MTKKYEGIVDINNTDYHAQKEHISSSNLKTLLKDPAAFYDQKILGNREIVSKALQAIFNDGTLAHNLILEPHMFDTDFEVFDGLRKAGKAWEAFKLQHKDSGKVLISKSQLRKVNMWVDSYRNLPAAVDLIKGGKSELALFGELEGVPIKVMCDYINIESGYIADVKTTSGLIDVDSFRDTVNSFSYQLSAALYSQMFEKHYGRPFDFYFVVLGKRCVTCEVFKLSKKSRKEGDKMVKQALDIYKKCKESGIWEKEVEFNDDENNKGDYEILEI
jgi:hypothetical protein